MLWKLNSPQPIMGYPCGSTCAFMTRCQYCQLQIGYFRCNSTWAFRCWGCYRYRGQFAHRLQGHCGPYAPSYRAGLLIREGESALLNCNDLAFNQKTRSLLEESVRQGIARPSNWSLGPITKAAIDQVPWWLWPLGTLMVGSGILGSWDEGT